MINFFFEDVTDDLHRDGLLTWIGNVIGSENKKEGELNFIFCSDAYLLKINKQFLDHDTYTDIISFDNSLGNELYGDIFISLERVKENASTFGVTEDEERRRVMIHGVLHFCGYKDKTEEESLLMRKKENEKLALFHVEQR